MLGKNMPKVQYSEHEAARKLGVSVEQLRAMVRRHIGAQGEGPVATVYQPADLILLQFLAGQRTAS